VRMPKQPAHSRLRRLASPALLHSVSSVVFADRVLGVVSGMQMMRMGEMGMMSCLLVVAFAVVACRFTVVVGCL
jgi:hypothetical protein